MTLLIGPPGSGKSTLLRALSGRTRPDRYTRVEVGAASCRRWNENDAAPQQAAAGTVPFVWDSPATVTGAWPPSIPAQGLVQHNGRPIGDFAVARSSAYVNQADAHTAALTVRETLEFAEACLGENEIVRRLLFGTEEDEKVCARARACVCWGGLVHGRGLCAVQLVKCDGPLPCARLRPQADALLAHLVAGGHFLMTEYMLHVFGLMRAAGTLVGGGMLRGIRCGADGPLRLFHWTQGRGRRCAASRARGRAVCRVTAIGSKPHSRVSPSQWRREAARHAGRDARRPSTAVLPGCHQLGFERTALACATCKNG